MNGSTFQIISKREDVSNKSKFSLFSRDKIRITFNKRVYGREMAPRTTEATE